MKIKVMFFMAILSFTALYAQVPENTLSGYLNGDPLAWIAFFDDSAVTEDAVMKGLGDSLVLKSGKEVSGVPFVMNNSLCDLNEIGGFTPKNARPGVIAAILESDRECVMTAGCGIDWWYDIYFNGTLVYSTGRNGNGTGAHAFCSVFQLPIKKGRNLITIFTRSGSDTWETAFALFPKYYPHEMVSALGAIRAFAGDGMGIAGGPFPLYPASDSITLSLLLKRNDRAVLEYRKKGCEKWKRIEQRFRGTEHYAEFHLFKLNNLEPDTEYEYRFELMDDPSGKLTPQKKIYAFRTAPRTESHFRFFYLSDLQMHQKAKMRYVEEYFHKAGLDKASFLFSGGDAAHGFSNLRNVYFDTYFSIIARLSENKIAFVPFRGNHEHGGPEAENFFNHFTKPFGMFRYGNICFIYIDPHDGGDEYTAEQDAFLRKSVESDEFKNADFRIVLNHFPPVSIQPKNNPVRQAVQDLFCGEKPKHRIHLWINGHTHVAFRWDPGSKILKDNATIRRKFQLNPGKLVGVPFPVVGTAGPGRDKEPHSGLCVDVSPKRILVKNITPSGKILDEFSITPSGNLTEHFSSLEIYPARKK